MHHPGYQHFNMHPAHCRWRTLTKWTGAARQAIHQIAFLESDPSFCCVSGLDQEVTCARWGKPPSSARPFPNGTDEAGAAPAPAPPTPGVWARLGLSAVCMLALPARLAWAPGLCRRSAARMLAPLTQCHAPSSSAVLALTCCAVSAADVVAYRGDARWLGVAKAAGADVLAGLAASGNVVYADLQLTGQQHTQDGE